MKSNLLAIFKTSFVVSIILTLSSSQNTLAAALIQISEVGGNVEITLSGNLNVTGLSSTTESTSPDSSTLVAPFLGRVDFLESSVFIDRYSGALTDPFDFGGVSFSFADTANIGTNFLLEATTRTVFLPADYATGNPLNASMTFEGETLASLNIANLYFMNVNSFFLIFVYCISTCVCMCLLCK